jgi:hypothetical protein
MVQLNLQACFFFFNTARQEASFLEKVSKFHHSIQA